MFKIIYRTLIILFAAAIVAFGLSWFSGTSAGQTLFASGGGHDRPAITQTAQTTTTQSSAPAFRGDFGGGDHEGGGVNITRALSDLPGKISIIAAITIAVVLTRKLLSLLSHKHGPGSAIPA